MAYEKDIKQIIKLLDRQDYYSAWQKIDKEWHEKEWKEFILQIRHQTIAELFVKILEHYKTTNWLCLKDFENIIRKNSDNYPKHPCEESGGKMHEILNNTLTRRLTIDEYKKVVGLISLESKRAREEEREKIFNELMN